MRPTYQQAGIQSDAEAIKVLLGWEAGFRNPATREQSFQNLARQYGFNLQSLVPSSQSGSPSAAQDIPEPLRNQFGQIQQTAQEAIQRVQSFEQQQISRELTAFASDPKHPHYEVVRVKMGQLMGAGIASGLEDAYQQAVAIDPAISAQIRAEDERKKAAEQAAEKAEKLKRASSAAVSPSARPPTGQAGAAAPPKSSVRESLLSNIKALREEQRA